MNNVDLAITKVRELQSLFYDANSSPNSLFKKSQEVIEFMNKASVEINTNYKEISRKLTEQMNSGKIQD
jgi:transposase